MRILSKVTVSGVDKVGRKFAAALSLERCEAVTTKNLTSASAGVASTAVSDEVSTTRLVLRRHKFISSNSSATSSPIPADKTEECDGAERVEGKEFEGDVCAYL